MILQGGKNRVSDRTAAVLLRDLTIENYRSFDKYRLDNLARVNLLVGDNNCGKTSVLEAVHILIALGQISCILETLSHRKALRRFSGPRGASLHLPDVAQLFFNNSESNKNGQSHVAFQQFQVEGNGDFHDNEDVDANVSVSCKPSIDNSAVEFESVASINCEALLEQKFQMRYGTPSSVVPSPQTKARSNSNQREVRRNRHKFLPPDRLSIKELSESWGQVIREQLDGLANHALSQLLDEQVSNIHFLLPLQSLSDIYIDSARNRNQLSKLGYGTYCIFSIFIALAQSQRGIAMIDEIDTGIHYSRIVDMWKFVIQSAKDLDVQVFATTHSLDCLNGLCEALQRDESLSEHVAVHRIERSHGIREAITLDGDEFVRAMLRESEIR